MAWSETKKAVITLFSSIVAAVIIALITNYLPKPKETYKNSEDSTTIKKVIPLSSNIDSGKQNIRSAKINSSNSGPGNTYNENVEGDKVTNNNNYSTQKNYYNKQGKDFKERHVTEADLKRIRQEIPLDFLVTIQFIWQHPEVENYVNEFAIKLKAIGYKVELQKLSYINEAYNPRFSIQLGDFDTVSKRIVIFPQQH